MWFATSRDDILAEFVPQFREPQRCIDALNRYISTAEVLDEQRARNWLQRPLLRDQELANIASDPENSVVGPSRYDLNGCYHCYGRGYVRSGSLQDVKATLCPACAGRDGDRSSHCQKCAEFTAKNDAATWGSNRDQCEVCRQFVDEPAAAGCDEPGRHHPDEVPELAADGPFMRIYRRRMAAGDTPAAQTQAQAEVSTVLRTLGESLTDA